MNSPRRGKSFDGFSQAHENLVYFLLEEDLKTIAVELPLVIEKSQFKNYKQQLGSIKPLSGHIDVVRFEDDDFFGWDENTPPTKAQFSSKGKASRKYRLGIWDYKPHASREKHAHVQVFLYSLMLSVKSGIPLERFICGWFDDHDLYYYIPSNVNFSPNVEYGLRVLSA